MSSGELQLLSDLNDKVTRCLGQTKRDRHIDRERQREREREREREGGGSERERERKAHR